MLASISKQKFNDGEGKLSVTATIGVASCKWYDTDESLIKRADKALCAAKKGGRNMVITEDGI